MSDGGQHIRSRDPEEGRDLSYPPLPEALTVGVYDNHTHLEISDGDNPLGYQEQLDRASSVGVRGVVQVGTDLETSRWSADIAAVEPRILAAVSIHPNEAPEYEASGRLDSAIEELDSLASRPRVRAIGETGLDFFRTGEDGRNAQYKSFEAHIELAKKNNLALQIHDRDAHDEVVETLLRVGAPERTVFHCFSGDVDFARVCIENNWYMSFAGVVTFKSAQNLRDALEIIPPHLLLVETDAPYLTPMPFRGRPNAPYLIPLTVRAMAAARGTDVSMLSALIATNTEQVYGVWDSQPITEPITIFDRPLDFDGPASEHPA